MNEVEEVRSRVNIIDIVGKRVKLKKAGRNYKGLCPFHNEKTPSFMVSAERGSWHCFGCGKGGSVFDFVMEYEHVDFREALETLAEIAGVKLTKRSPQTKEEKLIDQIYQVNHLASEYYTYLLTKHDLGKGARDYFLYRGMTEALIKTFGLGYSPKSWDALSKFLKKKGYDESVLLASGLVVKSQRGGFYDRFRGRAMFRLSDHRGRVVGFSGRLLDNDTKEAKYINTSETPVYVKGNLLYGIDVTKSAIAKAGEAVVVEGEFDVISSYAAGISNIVAIKGSAFTEGHVNLLRRFCDRIVFALDADVAGDAASRRGIEIADKAGLELRVAQLPMGKDPDDLSRHSPVLFKKAIKDALPLYDYLLDSASRRMGIGSAHGKRKASEELLPWFAKIENQIVLSHYVKKLAGLLEVSEEVIADGLRKVERRGYWQSGTVQPSLITRGRREKLEVYILALLLQGKTAEWAEELFEVVAISDFSLLPVQRILDNLVKHLASHNVFLIKDFVDTLPAELVPILDEAFLWDLSDLSGSEEAFAQEWTRALGELRKLVVKNKLVLASQALDNASNDERERLENEVKQLSRDLAVLEKKL